MIKTQRLKVNSRSNLRIKAFAPKARNLLLSLEGEEVEEAYIGPAGGRGLSRNIQVLFCTT